MPNYVPNFEDARVVEIARNRGILGATEDFDMLFERVTATLGRVDAGLTGGQSERFRRELDAALRSGLVSPSSQLLSSLGRSTDVAACTVLRFDGEGDTDRTRKVIARALAASSDGMGCGIDITEAEDPVTTLKTINGALHQAQNILRGQRRRPPALMVTCGAGHPRIEEFIRAKADADFSEWVVNISVRLSGADEEFARLLPVIAASAHRTGEPGILFQDAADRDNPTPEHALTSTAPCAEVFLAPNERCVFFSINLAAHVQAGSLDLELLQRSIRLSVRAADAAVELAAQGADPVVAGRRRIGVGVCGFHSMLVMLGIPYALSAPLASMIARELTLTAHEASADLAELRGAFPLWKGSRWQDPLWVGRKHSAFNSPDHQVRHAALCRRVAASGIRNASIVAFPPTGVVAEILGVSKSYEPHFTLVTRTGADGSSLRIAPEVRGMLEERGDDAALEGLIRPGPAFQRPGVGLEHILACARQIPVSAHLDVHSAFCSVADESGSKTVNLPAASTVDEVADLLCQVKAAGLKGVTIFREGCLEDRTPEQRSAK